jgi:hypothetical protein
MYHGNIAKKYRAYRDKRKKGHQHFRKHRKSDEIETKFNYIRNNKKKQSFTHLFDR